MRHAETIKKALFYGVAGTIAMTVFAAFAPHIYLPSDDMYGTLTKLLPMGSAGITLAYFGLGAVLAYIYGSYVREHLPTHSWLRGIFYAIVLFFAAHAIVLPALGHGFFSGSMSSMVGMLLGMSAFGVTVEYLYGHK